MGALDVREARTSPDSPSASDMHSLQYVLQAAEAVENGAPVPANLEDFLGAGPSAGGARPKATVRDDEHRRLGVRAQTRIIDAPKHARRRFAGFVLIALQNDVAKMLHALARIHQEDFIGERQRQIGNRTADRGIHHPAGHEKRVGPAPT